jgi:hypothetical protein
MFLMARWANLEALDLQGLKVVQGGLEGQVALGTLAVLEGLEAVDLMALEEALGLRALKVVLVLKAELVLKVVLALKVALGEQVEQVVQAELEV